MSSLQGADTTEIWLLNCSTIELQVVIRQLGLE